MSPKQIWSKVPRFLKNRYAITLFIFVFWMVFFDKNDLITQFQLRQELSKKQEEARFYRESLELDEASFNELLNDNEKLEKFAREKYFMKKPEEVVFAIVHETDSESE